MKVLTYAFLVAGTDAQMWPVGADKSCKNNRINCEYNLQCNGPLVEKANLTHSEYLCVEFDVCKNHKAIYIPETGGPNIEGVEFK